MASDPKKTTGRLYLLELGFGLEEDTVNTINRKKTLGKETKEERPLVQTLFIAGLLFITQQKIQNISETLFQIFWKSIWNIWINRTVQSSAFEWIIWNIGETGDMNAPKGVHQV